MLCDKCLEYLPDDSLVCSKCGQTVGAERGKGTATARPVRSTTEPSRVRRQSMAGIWVFLLLLLVSVLGGIWWLVTKANNPSGQGILAGGHTEPIAQKTFSVNPHSFSSFKFSVPSGAVNVSVNGQFTTKGGVGHEVQVYVLSDDAFVTWRNGYSINPFFDGGKVLLGNIQASLPDGEGTYYVVFNNNFSLKVAKAVQADVTVHYNTWWPDWVYQIKNKFWSP